MLPSLIHNQFPQYFQIQSTSKSAEAVPPGGRQQNQRCLGRGDRSSDNGGWSLTWRVVLDLRDTFSDYDMDLVDWGFEAAIMATDLSGSCRSLGRGRSDGEMNSGCGSRRRTPSDLRSRLRLGDPGNGTRGLVVVGSG